MYQGEFIKKAPFIQVLKKRVEGWGIERWENVSEHIKIFSQGYHDALQDLIFDLEDGMSI